MRGGDRSLSALFDTFAEFDALTNHTSLEVPIFLFHGVHDRVISALPAEKYLKKITAPIKEMVWFENSAHNPHWEEPKKYLDEVLRVTRLK